VKKKHFTFIEHVRKGFEIIQSHFAIIYNHCGLWHMDTIYEIMVACAISHNIIIKVEKE
jgi:hypothetical protein